MPNTDLDDRIRNLVASAVADAPPAPDIDPSVVPSAAQRAPWLRRGAIAVATLLAAAGGGYAVFQPADEGDVETVNSPTTIPAPLPSPSVIVTAGPDGVRAIVDGESRVITNEPMAFAIALDNGDVVAQRGLTGDVPDAETFPLLITKDGAITSLVDIEPSSYAFLHDFAVVDGRRVLLYSVRFFDGSIETSREVLYALDLDSRDSTEIDVIGGWESGTSRLHLGSNGLIVGTRSAEATYSLYAYALPGSVAASRPLPRITDFGLSTQYEDCPACPTGFVLDHTGTTLYWVDQARNVVMAAAIDNPSEASEVANLPFAHAVIDVSQRGIVAALTHSSESPALVANGQARSLGGTFATVGPNG